MIKQLIIQVLGNSDIQIDGENACKRLSDCYTPEDIEEVVRKNVTKFASGRISVDFPFLRESVHSTPDKVSNTFCVLLTDQSVWLSSNKQAPEDWQSFAASDGHWWKELLLEWCNREGILCYPLTLSVDPKTRNGVADWEAMAELIYTLLGESISFNKDRNKWTAFDTTFDALIAQYSSGTAALSSALYLWGIEQRLAARKISFVYLSPQEGGSKSTPHEGTHWQWRLKVPQLLQLIDIQDFGGALELIRNDSLANQQIKDLLRALDLAVSLNLHGAGSLGANIERDDS